MNQPLNPPVFVDGQFNFFVQKSDGTQEPYTIDVLELKLICEEQERAHNLEKNERGAYIATAAFLRDLKSQFQLAGIHSCTSSMAYTLWHAAGEKFSELKKNIETPPSLPTGLSLTQEQ